MLLLFAAAVFVGNDACKPCHAEIWARYLRTPMARSSGRVEVVMPGEFRQRSSGVTYRIAANGTVREQSGQRQLAYFVGSGQHGISYLEDRAGFLFQAPITWYAKLNRWEVSPGYEYDRAPDWSRPIEPSCLYCHSSQVANIYGTLNRYADPPFHQSGVACERCHGAGSEHIAGRGRMVVPSALDPVRRDDVCRQCHLSGEARIAREGKHFALYRAGDLLSDYVSYFVFDAPQEDLKVTSHVEKLLQSRCKVATGAALWCGTCHDSHSGSVRAGNACLDCHWLDPCRRGANCASCHMPKATASDAQHGVFTDHSIPRRPRRVRFQSAPPWRLRAFAPTEAGNRELGLAYLELSRRTRDPRQKAEGERLLRGIIMKQ
jgi:hypothetical protein